MNIHQRINAVMKDSEYLRKEAAQQGKGVKYDTVIAMLRELLIKHGIVMVVRQFEMASLSGVEGTKQKIYQGRYEMDLINMDEPEQIVTHSAFAHGMDGGDKAPGKAHTYAVKIMLVKGFALETGEDEESRAEKTDKKNTITQLQINELYPLVTIQGDNGIELNAIGQKLLSAYKIGNIESLPLSKFNEAMARVNKMIGAIK